LLEFGGTRTFGAPAMTTQIDRRSAGAMAKDFADWAVELASPSMTDRRSIRTVT